MINIAFLTFLLLLIKIYTNYNPLETCQDQKSCLAVHISECFIGFREVCLRWHGGGYCAKAEGYDQKDEQFDYVCPVKNEIFNDQNTKYSSWQSNTNICQKVVGGMPAKFSIGDGTQCMGTGNYKIKRSFIREGNDTEIFGEISATCIGQTKYCKNGETIECLWSIPTPPCDIESLPCCSCTKICG